MIYHSEFRYATEYTEGFADILYDLSNEKSWYIPILIVRIYALMIYTVTNGFPVIILNEGDV